MRRLLIASSAALLVVSVPAAAAPRDLDRSFGTAGRLFAEGILGGFGEDDTGLAALSTLPDGRIVLLGTERCSLSCDPFLVLSRRTPAGGPDMTLTAGRSPGVLAVPGGDDADPQSSDVFGVALRPDGGLVLGRTRTSSSALVPYGPDGVAGTSVPSAVPVRPEVVLPDGRVLGRAGRSGRSVVRLSPSLARDPSFGAGHAVVIPAGLSLPLPLVVTGGAVVSGSYNARGLVLWRTTADATTTATVSTVRVPGSGPAAVTGLGAREVVSARGGRSLVVGTAIRARGFMPVAVLARFDRTGRADPTFGRDGVTRVSGREPAVAVDRSGRIVIVTLAGRLPEPGAEVRLVVRRLGPRGGADPSFGTRVISLGRGYTAGPRVSIDPSRRILVGVGFTSLSAPGGVVLLRFHGGPGR